MSQPKKLGTYASASVEVNSALAKPPDNIDELTALLQRKIINGLNSQRAFESIQSRAANDSSDLQIVVTLTKVRNVNSVSRIMIGMLAGPSSAEATVELRERVADNLISSNGVASGGDVTGSASEAIDALADQIVKLVCKSL